VPYFRDLSPLRRATSIEELRRWAEHEQAGGFGFNGDALRVAVVNEVFKATGCSVFLETGTFRAATTLLAARMLGCPVYTSELNRKYWLLAAARCAPFPRVHPRRADSREFLKAMARELPPSAVPFIYLDAHWYEDLPLQAEIDIVFGAWRRFVLLIDDFQVPGKPGFGFDTYAGQPLSLDTVRFPLERLDAPSDIFFPAYASDEETGARRGYVLVAGGLRDSIESADHFPLNLLEKHADAKVGT
jgi:hypothetical protein